MGLRCAILLVSLGINLVLAVLVIRSPQPAPSSTTTSSQLKSEAASNSSRHERSQQSPAAQDEIAAKPGFNWTQLESQDYLEYVARLRAFAVPERTIRDIILADVGKLYRPRLAALRPAPSIRTNFWEQYGGYAPRRQSKEEREQLSALQKEQTELIKNLLGKDVYQEMSREGGGMDWLERSFGKIPTEHREKVTEMNERFQQITAEIHAKSDGYFDQDTQAELKAARRKFREELGSVLTPAQLEDYELRTSDVANNMRYQLRAFEPNEEEFRAVFNYKQAMEDLASTRNPGDPATRPSPEEMKARQQRQKEMEEALAQTLGPDRAKEYKLMDQYEFQNLFEAGIPKENVFKVADMKQEVEAAARKIQQNKALTSEQRTEALTAIRAETEKTLAELLGERRARGYASQGGYWLRSLVPRQSSSP